MDSLVQRLTFPRGAHPEPNQEWLVTNGLGGYASGTVAGIITRRYHGLLIAALPVPLGRVVMLSHLEARLRTRNGQLIFLDLDLSNPRSADRQQADLVEFRLETGLPVWRYQADGITIEKRVLMPYRQNTVHVNFRLVESPEPLRLELTPFMHFRHHEDTVSDELSTPYGLTVLENRFEIHAAPEQPALRLLIHGQEATMTLDRRQISHLTYLEEQHRGYPSVGALWSPGFFHLDLDLARSKSDQASLLASTETWETLRALSPVDAADAEQARRAQLLAQAPENAQEGFPAALVLAADQFVVSPAGRIEEATRARASGDEVRTIIAGYHWFTDWGRDTMISFEGLTLLTGRYREAGFILRTFAHYVRDGLIPNMFPEGEREGLYHTADATLWFFHAIDRYVRVTHDQRTVRRLLPTLQTIMDAHLRGTRFGIGVDSSDDLLRQGAEGYQLTWMDAKVDGWVVTPRRGKTVETNALYYNALRLLADWLEADGQPKAAAVLADRANRTRASFNRRFWYEAGGYLYDVVDGERGDDTACRPNQLFAVSLTHPVLDEHRWRAVVDVVRSRLLTPVGLRTLSNDHVDYRAQYYGDLRSRDAAYHQGTVWAWLIGPFIDAWLRVSPDQKPAARDMLRAFEPHLTQACIGSISEIFDAEAPFTPRGCIAQAWSVAEVLRAWIRCA